MKMKKEWRAVTYNSWTDSESPEKNRQAVSVFFLDYTIHLLKAAVDKFPNSFDGLF